jgi:hypothetical protein
MVTSRFWLSHFWPGLLAMSLRVTPLPELVPTPQNLGLANEKRLPTQLLRRKRGKPQGDL